MCNALVSVYWFAWVNTVIVRSRIQANYKYKLEQKMTEFGLSSISAAFLNFSSNSTLPITLAAWIICLINSWSRRKTRIKLPSNWSVNYH